MIYILWTLIVFFGIFLSVTYPPIFSIAGIVRIDLLMVILSLYALYLSPYFTLPVFFIAGLIFDSFFMNPLGYHSLIFIGISYAIFLVKGYIFKEKFMFQILVISMAAFLYRIADTAVFYSRIKSFSYAFCNVVLSPIATILFYSLIYVLVVILQKAVNEHGKRKQAS
ncbi:MAG: rod shape-determining protein MreD [bacterium]